MNLWMVPTDPATDTEPLAFLRLTYGTFFVAQVVATKVDKCGHRALLTNLLNLQEVINKHTTSCFPQPFLVR